MNIGPDATVNIMEEDQPITAITEQHDQCTRSRQFVCLDETMDLTEDINDKPHTLVNKLSRLLGWCSNTKPDNEQLVKLCHIGVKMLRYNNYIEKC